MNETISAFSIQLCCVLRDLTPILHMVLKQYADDTEVTEVNENGRWMTIKNACVIL